MGNPVICVYLIVCPWAWAPSKKAAAVAVAVGGGPARSNARSALGVEERTEPARFPRMLKQRKLSSE
eukprot:1546326-Pyramimonas_sp.AAC.1